MNNSLRFLFNNLTINRRKSKSFLSLSFSHTLEEVYTEHRVNTEETTS